MIKTKPVFQYEKDEEIKKILDEEIQKRLDIIEKQGIEEKQKFIKKLDEKKRNEHMRPVDSIRITDTTDVMFIGIPYKKEELIFDKDHIPVYCGVYVLTLKNGKRYVGSSINIKTRVNAHKRHKKDINTITVYLTTDIFDTSILEYYLIKTLKPELNMEFGILE